MRVDRDLPSLYGYRSRRPAFAGLRERISEIAAVKLRYGYWRMYVRPRREGWEVNRKRVYRLYREAGLAAAAQTGRPGREQTVAQADGGKPDLVDGLRCGWLGGRQASALPEHRG